MSGYSVLIVVMLSTFASLAVFLLQDEEMAPTNRGFDEAQQEAIDSETTDAFEIDGADATEGESASETDEEPSLEPARQSAAVD
jgi:hypothetical protein